MKQRLEKLQQEIADHDIDLYLLPSNDLFQGEYTHAADKRLAWISGFTGSAGMVAITPNKANIAVAHLYELQAKREVDGDLWSIMSYEREKPDKTLVNLIKKTIGETGKVGFDPWLYTPDTVSYLRQRLPGIELKPLKSNLIDQVWGDGRPNREEPPAYRLEIAITGRSHKDKVEELVEAIKKANCHGIIISDPFSVCWLLNIRGGSIPCTPVLNSMLYVTAQGQVRLFAQLGTVSFELSQELGIEKDILPVREMINALSQLDQKGRIWVDPETTPFAIVEGLKESGFELYAETDPTQLPRACKNRHEIKAMEKAQRQDALAMSGFREWLLNHEMPETLTELNIVQQIHHFRSLQKDFEQESFNTIAGVQGNGAIIHYNPTRESSLTLGSNTLLLMDSGGQYRCGGTTDITRVFPIGKPSDEMKDRYTRVLKGLIDLTIAEFKEGSSGKDLDHLARAPLQEINLDFPHSTGHGVGAFLSVHEGPQKISPLNDQPLLPGMILSNEPGYYKEGEYGIRLENLMIVEQSSDRESYLKFRTLTFVPFEMEMVDQKLLSDAELKWLNWYHQQC